MIDKEERYKVEGIGVVVDTHTDTKYDLESAVKVLNDTERFRVHHQEQRKVFENVAYDMIDVINWNG